MFFNVFYLSLISVQYVFNIEIGELIWCLLHDMFESVNRHFRYFWLATCISDAQHVAFHHSNMLFSLIKHLAIQSMCSLSFYREEKYYREIYQFIISYRFLFFLRKLTYTFFITLITSFHLVNTNTWKEIKDIIFWSLWHDLLELKIMFMKL